MSNTRGLISQGARRRGLDPLAVLAVASAEGLGSSRPGDNGTSFGPFQLHMGGALPRAHYGDAGRWASSPQGIAYALDQIAKVARGKHGRAAIAAIVRGFERPAAPGAEIEKASSRYGRVGGGVAGPSPSAPAAAQAAAPDKHEIAMQLISTLGQDHPDVGALIPLVAAGRAASPARASQAARGANRGDIGPSTEASSEHSARSGINELFYDPLGGIKNGQRIAAIGGHRDHVHMALASEAAQRAAIAQAQRMGLSVGQDTDANVTQVHVKNSYHYRHFSRGLRQAADVSGDPRRMAAFFKWVQRRYG